MGTVFRLLMVLIVPGLLLACSSPQSQERLKVIGCWLRPSCLPEHSPPSRQSSQSTTSPPQSLPGKSAQPSETLSPGIRSSNNRNVSTSKGPKCAASAEILVPASAPSIMVSYVEPTTNAKGQKLTNLAKTTIYVDIGNRIEKYKEIEASNPAGGGQIREKITLNVKPAESLQAKVCATATSTYGRES